MKIFADTNIKKLFTIVALILIGFVLLLQLAAALFAENYKENMVAHDAAIAGYLVQNGMDETDAAKVLASGMIEGDRNRGQEILRRAGYEKDMQIDLLPQVKQFYKNTSGILLLFSAACFVCVLFFAGHFIFHREMLYENADADIRKFMSGDGNVRLCDNRDGGIYRFFSSVNELATSLTAHIEKEKQSRMFLKDTVQDISHQLKTPLAALAMYNEIMLDDRNNAEVVETFVVKSERELKRMETLIQNLLKLARLDADAITLELQQHSLQPFLEECIKSFLTRAEMEEKTIEIQCEENIVLLFDAMWMREAIGNLIKNALDHTATGGRIAIECRQTPVVAEIIVKDNGAGIHPEDIHCIFKRFYRSRFSNDRQGAGIGLALTEAIIEKHGASISVQSEPGEGAAFSIVFSSLSKL